jgi:hypothetical protein
MRHPRRSAPRRSCLLLLALSGCAGSAAPERSPRLAAPRATPAPLPRDCSVYDTAPEYPKWSVRARTTSRVECQLNNEFHAFVGAHVACTTTNDCNVVDTACPFGCGVAIEHTEAVRSEYQALAERFE